MSRFDSSVWSLSESRLFDFFTRWKQPWGNDSQAVPPQDVSLISSSLVEPPLERIIWSNYLLLSPNVLRQDLESLERWFEEARVETASAVGVYRDTWMLKQLVYQAVVRKLDYCQQARSELLKYDDSRPTHRSDREVFVTRLQEAGRQMVNILTLLHCIYLV